MQHRPRWLGISLAAAVLGLALPVDGQEQPVRVASAAPAATGPKLKRPLWVVPDLAERLGLKRPGWARPGPIRCRPGEDVLLPLAYVDGGQMWIPWEVACGGRAHVLIVLHGNQGDRDPAPALGGGRHVERIVRELMSEGMVRPVILAEPIHFSFCGDGHGQGLYSEGFSFAQYRKLLEHLAAERGIRILSYSVLGHSASGCCLAGGIFKAAEELKQLRLLVTSDTCYSPLYARRLNEVLTPDTLYLNITGRTLERPDYRRFERGVFSAEPALLDHCDPTLYRRCIRHASHPWYSFITRRGDLLYHSTIAKLAVRNALGLAFGGPRVAVPRVVKPTAPAPRPEPRPTLPPAAAARLGTEPKGWR